MIGDFVWEDLDDDGIQEAGEPGIPGVAVDLLNGIGDVIASTVTDANGNYGFEITDPGSYSVAFDTPDGFDIGLEFAGTDEAIDSNLLPVGFTPFFDVTVADMLSSDGNLTIDAAFVFVELPEIPETGADADRLALLAGGLLVLGIGLLLGSRRRRSE